MTIHIAEPFAPVSGSVFPILLRTTEQLLPQVLNLIFAQLSPARGHSGASQVAA